MNPMSANGTKRRFTATHSLTLFGAQRTFVQLRLQQPDLRASGVEILFEENLRERVFQGKQVYFHDPDSNVIELVASERIGQGFGVDNVPERKSHFVNKPPGA